MDLDGRVFAEIPADHRERIQFAGGRLLDTGAHWVSREFVWDTYDPAAEWAAGMTFAYAHLGYKYQVYHVRVCTIRSVIEPR